MSTGARAVLCISFLAAFFLHITNGTVIIGVNYGQMGNNLPLPRKVVQLLQSTKIGKVKIYDSNPVIIEAFANTGFEVIVGVKNEEIPSLQNASAALRWVKQNVAAYLPATQIKIISVGNEILTADTQLGTQLVPAMKNIHAALIQLNLDNQVKVSTPNSLAILSSSYPPSSGAFKPELTPSIIQPMLQFLDQTASPFMINTYPYFAYKSSPLDIPLAYALFLPSAGIVDPKTQLHYDNLLDAQVDAVISAINKLGFYNMGMILSESGWPSAGDAAEIGATIPNAMTYSKNLINHVSMRGTPLRPQQRLDTYIFALFNENQKPGATSERNFGLYHPDGSPVYDVGLNVAPTLAPDPATPNPHTAAPTLPAATPTSTPTLPPPALTPPPLASTSQPPPASPTPNAGSHLWCIARSGADPSALQTSLNFACGDGGADCGPIQPGGACFMPNAVSAHASFAFNSYYQKHGRNNWDCNFNNTALVSATDPSTGSCIYPSL